MTFPRHLLWLALLASAPACAQDACPPEGVDAGSLRGLKQQKFAVEDAVKRNALALGLLGCLSSPDPVLRDGITYEALAQWMRSDQLDLVVIPPQIS